jgi:hypothetical protein
MIDDAHHPDNADHERASVTSAPDPRFVSDPFDPRLVNDPRDPRFPVAP